MSAVQSPEGFIQFLQDYHGILDKSLHEGVDASTRIRIAEVYNHVIFAKYREYKKLFGNRLPQIRNSVNCALEKLKRIEAVSSRHLRSEAARHTPSASSGEAVQTVRESGIIPEGRDPLIYFGLKASHTQKEALQTLTGFRMGEDVFPGNILLMEDYLEKFPIRHGATMDKYLSDFSRYIYRPYLEVYRDLSSEHAQVSDHVFVVQQELIEQMSAYVGQAPIRNDQDLERYMTHFREHVYGPYLEACDHLSAEMRNKLGKSVFKLHRILIEQMSEYLKKPLILNEQILERYKIDYFNECIFLPYNGQARNVEDLDHNALKNAVSKLQRELDTRIKALEDDKKKGWLNWGLAAIPAIGTYMALPALTKALPLSLGSYWGHPLFRGVVALGAGGLLVGNKKTLSEGARRSLATGTLAGVQIAGDTLGSSSISTTFASLNHAINILSQPTMADSVKSTAKAAAALGVGMLTTACVKYLGADPYLLEPMMTRKAMDGANVALNSSTWKDTFKGFGKGAFSVGAGLTVQGGLTYLGFPVIVSSAIAAVVTQKFTSLWGSKSAKEALEKTARTTVGVGIGLLTHKIYSAAGVEAVPKQVCGKSKAGETVCTLSYKEAYENAGATMIAAMSASTERRGTLREQIWATAKDITLAIGGSAVISNLGYFGIPSEIRTMISIGFGLYRARHLYQEIYNETKKVGEALVS